MARPKGTAKVKKAIRKADFEKLLDFVSKNKMMNHPTRQKLKIAYTILYCTGCRISEIIRFTKDDLEQIVKHKEFSLDNRTKTKSPRFIEFSDSQIDLINKVIPKESGFLFKKNMSLEPMTITGLTTMCNQYIQIALGELYSSHGFRRNMITQILHKTGRIKLAQLHIGHKSPSTTTRYDTPADGEIRNTLNSINW